MTVRNFDPNLGRRAGIRNYNPNLGRGLASSMSWPTSGWGTMSDWGFGEGANSFASQLQGPGSIAGQYGPVPQNYPGSGTLVPALQQFGQQQPQMSPQKATMAMSGSGVGTLPQSAETSGFVSNMPQALRPLSPVIGGNPLNSSINSPISISGKSDAELQRMLQEKQAQVQANDAWTLGDASTIIGGINTLGQLGMGAYQLYKSADAYDFQKGLAQRNLTNQATSYNTEMEGRIRGLNSNNRNTADVERQVTAARLSDKVGSK